MGTSGMAVQVHRSTDLYNDGFSDLPLSEQFALNSRSSTLSGKPLSRELRVASNFHSRTPLPEALARRWSRVPAAAERQPFGHRVDLR